jgi:coatomer protein complex subunit gamma
MNNPRQFKSAYETFKGSELQSTFQLDYKNTDIAVKELVKHFGTCL